MKNSYSLEYNKTKECEILIFDDEVNIDLRAGWMLCLQQ
jgi:hypothetical protein